jgi:hypothetical protein
MKKIELEEMLGDYDYVKRVIENKSNTLVHIAPLHNLIVNFRKKWKSIEVSSYLYDLRDRLSNLDERLFDEKIENLKNKI